MKIAAVDDFEHRYMQAFRKMASEYGIFAEYERDRATHDIGLRFTQQLQGSKDKIVTLALVWFQMKGTTTDRLSKAKFDESEAIKVTLETKHLIFWHVMPEPTYLVVYVESVDTFFVIDIKAYIGREFGDGILRTRQKSHVIQVSKKNVMDRLAFQQIMDANLYTALRDRIAGDDDQAKKFLRDSELVKALAKCNEGTIRLRVIKYMSKMRTELYFERYDEQEKDWSCIRTHWQYALPDLASALPYLDFFVPKVEEEDDDWYDDGECLEGLIELPNGEISVPLGQNEIFEHVIGVKLNAIGVAWAQTLEVLERCNLIVVDDTPKFLSVAPWHSRGVS